MYKTICITFWFSLHLSSVINAMCTKDPDFLEVTNSKDVFLCDTPSSCNKRYLSNGTTYVGCKKGDGPIRTFYIGIVEGRDDTPRVPYIHRECLKVDGWTSFLPCKPLAKIQFIQKPIPRYRVYAVICGNSTSQFPNQDQIQIQISGIRTRRMYTIISSNKTILTVTQTIPCASQCKEKPASYKVDATKKHLRHHIDPTNKALLRLYLSLTESSTAADYLMIYTCSNTDNFNSWTISFYVANSYESFLISKIGEMDKVSVLDSGTELKCSYVAYLIVPLLNINKTSTETPLKVNIYMSSFTAGEIPLSPVYAHSVKIPEKPSFSSAYIACFIGNLSYIRQNDGYRYYMNMTQHRFTMGSFYSTSYMFEDNTTVIDNDIEDSSILKCNETYYTKLFPSSLKSIRLGTVFHANLSLPYSSIITDSRAIKFVSTGNKFHFNRSKTLRMILFCLINDLHYTTPVEIFSGQRGILKFKNIFPDYLHEYSLRSFVYKCVGEFVVETFITCVNCTDDLLIIAEDSDVHSILTIPRSIRKNIVLTFFCYGKALKYRTWNDTIVLNIIAYDYTDFNDTYRFFMTKDYFNCISKFSIFVGNTSKEIKMPMPTKLRMDGFEPVTLPGTVPIFQLSPNRAVYQGCCEVYKDNQLTCNANWQDILVGNNFTVEWSLDLNDIYPNIDIRCHACVNYTSLAINKCVNENKVNSHIGIEIKRPDLTSERIGCQNKMFSVKSPKQMLKPDKKTFYRMADFEVTLICCVRGQGFRKSVKIKSCNENPPPIKIIPPDKHLFTVGESFSCTTEAIKCVQGIIYQIAVTVEGKQSQKIRAASIQFSSYHVGNIIEIKCLAGTEEEKTDSRVVRVEEAPHNVSIIGMLPILWYGRYLQCVAMGFPPPDIYWIQTNGPSLLRISEYSLLIGPWDISGNYTVICEAKNSRGVSSRTVSFKQYNPRLRHYDADLFFYITIPGLTLVFVCLMIGSMVLTFQEAFFGVPIFSTYKAKALKMAVFDKSKKV